MMKEKEIAKEAIAYAEKCGADQCEIYYHRHSSSSLQMRDGVLSDDSAADRSGYSVRLLKNGVPGFSYGTALEKDFLHRSIDDALLSCDFLEPDEDVSFTPPGSHYPEVDTVSAIPVLSFDRKKAYLQEMIAAAKIDPRITRVERVGLSQVESETFLFNSLGLELHRQMAMISAATTVVAVENEDEQLAGEFELGSSYDTIDFATIGKKAAENGLDKLGAGPIETAELPVIFTPDAVLDLLGLLLPSFMGDQVEKGTSSLKGRLGETIAVEDFSLYDDALLPGSVTKIPFDDEGRPCGRHCLVENGVAHSFLYDNRYASRAHTVSTGNGFCGSHKGMPGVGTTNVSLAKGNTDPEKMISGLTRGVVIKDLMGLHMADPVSGDFSLGAVGKLIENGEITTGVRGVMVAGNLFTMLKDIAAIGSDYKLIYGNGASSFLVKSLKISGK